jgi:DNA-directed RNA polymerase specialized sigma subunit
MRMPITTRQNRQKARPEEEGFRREPDDEICLEKINEMLAIFREEYWKVSRALQAYYNMRLRESGSEQRAYIQTHTSTEF